MFPRSGGGAKQLFDMLPPVIKEHILPGKPIISDMWKACDCLQDHNGPFISSSIYLSGPAEGEGQVGLQPPPPPPTFLEILKSY